MECRVAFPTVWLCYVLGNSYAHERVCGAHPDEKEVWEFLSAWSEVYGMECESSFLSSVSASIRGANSSARP